MTVESLSRSRPPGTSPARDETARANRAPASAAGSSLRPKSGISESEMPTCRRRAVPPASPRSLSFKGGLAALIVVV